MPLEMGKWGMEMEIGIVWYRNQVLPGITDAGLTSVTESLASVTDVH